MNNEVLLSSEIYNQMKDNRIRGGILRNVLPRLEPIENREYLEQNNIPYKIYMDMLITLHSPVCSNPVDKSASFMEFITIKISSSNLIDMKVTFDELYTLAINNLQKCYTIEPMVDVLQNLLGQSEIGYDSSTKELPDTPEMYIISTKHRTNGAAAILSDQVLQELYRHFEGSFVILPSSVHECIAVKLHDINDHAVIQDLIAMVKDINDHVVADDDVLSYSVYIYDNGILTKHSRQTMLQGA